MLLQVELHGVEVGNQRTAATEWPQPHIHAKTESLRSLGVEELDHRLPYPDKELLITDGFLFPSGRTCLGVKKYKIDYLQHSYYFNPYPQGLKFGKVLTL